jgi:hypothetical protein
MLGTPAYMPPEQALGRRTRSTGARTCGPSARRCSRLISGRAWCTRPTPRRRCSIRAATGRRRGSHRHAGGPAGHRRGRRPRAGVRAGGAVRGRRRRCRRRSPRPTSRCSTPRSRRRRCPAARGRSPTRVEPAVDVRHRAGGSRAGGHAGGHTAGQAAAGVAGDRGGRAGADAGGGARRDRERGGWADRADTAASLAGAGAGGGGGDRRGGRRGLRGVASELGVRDEHGLRGRRGPGDLPRRAQGRCAPLTTEHCRVLADDADGPRRRHAVDRRDVPAQAIRASDYGREASRLRRARAAATFTG